MIEKVNMSPVIMEKIMVTNGPVSLIALKKHNLVQGVRFEIYRYYIPCKEEKVEPTSRNSKDQEGFLKHPIILGARYLFRFILILNHID